MMTTSLNRFIKGQASRRRAERMDRTPHAVYVLHGEDGPLYVGSTVHLRRRLTEHASTKTWWPDVTSVEVIAVAPGRSTALAFEYVAIDQHRPAHNVVGIHRPAPWEARQVVEMRNHLAAVS